MGGTEGSDDDTFGDEFSTLRSSERLLTVHIDNHQGVGQNTIGDSLYPTVLVVDTQRGGIGVIDGVRHNERVQVLLYVEVGGARMGVNRGQLEVNNRGERESRDKDVPIGMRTDKNTRVLPFHDLHGSLRKGESLAGTVGSDN